MPFLRTDEGTSSRISCEGAVLKDVFIDAAHGLLDVVAGTSKIKGDIRQEIVVQAETVDALFREWLNELLARITQSHMLYSDFEVFSIQKASPKQHVLTGAVYGELYDAARHTPVQRVSLDEKKIVCKEGEGKSACAFVLTH